jgi:uncharacterized membrane protein
MADSSTLESRQPQILERNVRALVEYAAEQERTRTRGDRAAAAISRTVGTMNFVYFHIVFFGLWTALDLGWLPVRNFDPTFTILGTAAAIEAIFLATFVLIRQNHMAAQADLRNHLDLQVSLLTERETTHILRIVAAMSDKLGLTAAHSPEMNELLREVGPQDMLDRIEVHKDAVETEIREESTGQ